MSNHHEQLWSRCLSVIKDNISEASFNTWFAPIVALKYEENVFVLQVPSQFFVEYIEEKIHRSSAHDALPCGRAGYAPRISCAD